MKEKNISCDQTEFWKEDVMNYLSGKENDLSEEQLDHLRNCEGCLKELVRMRTAIHYAEKTTAFEKCLELEDRIRYKDGIIYEKADELLWDEALTGMTREQAKKWDSEIMERVLKRVEKRAKRRKKILAIKESLGKQKNTIKDAMTFELWHGGEIIEERKISRQRAAAGISKDIPEDVHITKSRIFDGEDISLTFEYRPDNHTLEIGLMGGSPAVRAKIKVEIEYTTGNKDIFDGKEIAHGGVWGIDKEKSKIIRLIRLSYGDEREK